MKINLVSDLHLGFGGIELPGGDVLILAGDIFEASVFKHQDRNKRYPIFKKFIDEELAKYSVVLYVMGNHEHYGSVFQTTKDTLKANLPDNVFLLQNEGMILEDVNFFGATMWTNFDKGDFFLQQYAQTRMNDFEYIKFDRYNTGITAVSRAPQLTPSNTVDEHNNSFNRLKTYVTGQKKVVVITHHAPSFKSVHSMYADDLCNFAYASDLSEFILDNPQIKTWVHGHMHTSHDYMIGDTRVICNPRGYREENKWFDPKFTFEV